VGHQDYFLAPLPGSIALFVSSLGIHIVRCNPFIMGKPHDGKFLYCYPLQEEVRL
jgi:hypothetical protein